MSEYVHYRGGGQTGYAKLIGRGILVEDIDGTIRLIVCNRSITWEYPLDGNLTIFQMEPDEGFFDQCPDGAKTERVVYTGKDAIVSYLNKISKGETR